ncbi:hypothetical protein CY34DRAFT_15907 [Suillus luteus UH-Slu-Lm8-n1]|uniref:Unplaced genomic scaffold CY34scaffold_341, whole genome shotgun sequence n=1 Tax=Suillus luteus UH-Slu-Lm8-n1 TaxID=930992 RepID=A0A0D0AG93_9AGAM|nr:hypothetical protein CY34DRAFT_15907 [Suillus luteus UH-Slu-Lm8-n1]
MAKSTRHGSSPQGDLSHARQGRELQDSEQLDDSAEENEVKGRGRRKGLVVMSDAEEEVDELCDGEIDDVSTHSRPEDMPSHILLNPPLKERYTAQDIAPGFMDVIQQRSRSIDFVRWYSDTAEGVGCFEKCFSDADADADASQCAQCAQQDIKCKYNVSQHSSQREFRCLSCGKGRGIDCSWSEDLKQAYLREAYQLDAGEARVLISSTEDDPQAVLAAYYQEWRTNPAIRALDDNVRLSLKKVQGNIRPQRVTRSKPNATTPTSSLPPSTPASAGPKLKGRSHNDLAASKQLAGPSSSHTRMKPSIATSDQLTPPPSTAGPVRLQAHGRPSVEPHDSLVHVEHPVVHHNMAGRLVDAAHTLADAQVYSTHMDASPAAKALGTVRPALLEIPGEAVQGLDQFLKSVLDSSSSATRPLQEKILSLEAELQQVKLELETEKSLRLAHFTDRDKIIADQGKIIADRDGVIAGQQRTIADLSRSIAKMDICTQTARHLISGQPNLPSTDTDPPLGGQCQVDTSDARNLMLTLLPKIAAHADLAGRQWVEQLCSLVQDPLPPILGKRPMGETSGREESGQESHAKRRRQLT